MEEKNKIRKAVVFFSDKKAGVLEENSYGYRFVYDDEYIKENPSISLSLPKQKKVHQSRPLFPFFLGLLPEGWYLDLVSKKLKIDKEDKFGLLLATCKDTVGAVSIRQAA
jgi:serine/threonine-protein kinase HipA